DHGRAATAPPPMRALSILGLVAGGGCVGPGGATGAVVAAVVPEAGLHLLGAGLKLGKRELPVMVGVELGETLGGEGVDDDLALGGIEVAVVVGVEAGHDAGAALGVIGRPVADGGRVSALGQRDRAACGERGDEGGESGGLLRETHLRFSYRLGCGARRR